jgi:hypothetical protein
VAYLLAMAAFLPIFGRLADLHKLVRKANGLQDFQRAGLNAGGTAVMGRPVVLIDNPAGNAMPIQRKLPNTARRDARNYRQGNGDQRPIILLAGPSREVSWCR